MLEAAGTFETSGNLYQTAWHNRPKDSHFRVVFFAVRAELLDTYTSVGFRRLRSSKNLEGRGRDPV
jgi:hypothetical protein